MSKIKMIRFFELLPGVSLLKGKIEKEPDQDGSMCLYESYKPTMVKEKEVQFYPYIAWINRGTTGQSVWTLVSCKCNYLFMRIIPILIGLLVSFGLSAQPLKEQALAKIDTLNELISIAESNNLDATREKSRVRTAEIFLDFADWDEANVGTNTSLFGMAHGFKDKPEYWASLLADFERNEVILLLEDAIEVLQNIIDGTYQRRPAIQLNWSEIDLEGDQLIQDGKPVFLLDYTWKPGIKRLTDYHGNKDGFGIYPSWVLDSEGTINSNRMGQLLEKENGRVGFVFFGNENPNAWTRDAYGDDFILSDLTAMYPEYYSGEVSRFTDYDIDNPGAREMMGALIDATVGHMSGMKYTEMGYMLCNEPHFYTTETNGKPNWGSSHVTDHTLEKFRTWLKERHDSISRVNQLWGTTHTSFESLTIEIPMDTEIQGSAKWYDWQCYNNTRVTEWYTWMKEKVQENDPYAKVHLKIMPNLWSNNKRGHGIDFETLTEISEIIGNDCGSAYNNVWSWREIEWDKDYSWDWRELAMSYDFLKSVSPEKSMINSESHFLSTGSSRDLYMKPDYARSTAWLSHLKGLTYEQVWYWNRLEDGSPKQSSKSYAASCNHQPRIIDAMTTTYLDLNAFGEEVMTFQRQRKPIRIFYSETSALNKAEHMDDVFELYEELAFDGISLGFATKNIIEKQEHENWDAILVYKTQFVTSEELEALQSYLDQGGTILVDAVSIKKNEYGIPLNTLEASSGTIINATSLSDMKQQAFNHLAANDLLPNIELSEMHSGTRNGCMWNVIEKDDGKQVLFVTNLGNTDATIRISLKDSIHGTWCKDLFTGIDLPSQLVLEPYKMHLLEISDSCQADTTQNNLRAKKTPQIHVFPNPFASILKIELGDSDYNRLRIFNLNGQLLEQINIEGRKEITLNESESIFNPGLHFLQFSGPDNLKYMKVVKN